jgi:hypothetical protein
LLKNISIYFSYLLFSIRIKHIACFKNIIKNKKNDKHNKNCRPRELNPYKWEIISHFPPGPALGFFC